MIIAVAVALAVAVLKLREGQRVRQVLVPPRSDDARIPHPVEKGHDHIVLLYRLAVDVFPDRLREVVSALPPVDRPPGHGRRLQSDLRLREHPVVVGFGEGGRRVESELASVIVQEVSLSLGRIPFLLLLEGRVRSKVSQSNSNLS